MSSLVKRSVSIGGHRTSVSLEAPFHAELEAIAADRQTSLAALIAEIDAARSPGTNLSSAIRLFVLAELKGQLAGTPNAATARAMADLDAGKARQFPSAAALFKELGL